MRARVLSQPCAVTRRAHTSDPCVCRHAAVSDFGVSKQLDSTQALAMTQVGSTAYMSPERLKGDEYGYPSDVWSLGVIVLEALLGAHPFPPGTYPSFIALYTAISSGSTPVCAHLPRAPTLYGLPSKRIRSTPLISQPPPEGTEPPLVDFVQRCLRLEPDERPSVEELLAGGWLGLGSVADARQPVLAWLMKAAARRLANRILGDED